MLEFLANIFLQTDSFSVTAIIIAAISAGVVGGGLILNAIRLGAENEARYIQIMREFIQDLDILYDNEKNIKTDDEADRYASKVLNVLGRIAYLSLRKKIPSHVTEFFNADLRYGKLLLEWYEFVGLAKMQSAEQTWFNLAKWCEEKNVERAPDVLLPVKLLKMIMEGQKIEKHPF